MKLESWRIVIIVICLALLMGGGADALFGMGSLGYTTASEGVRASFAGIEWNTGGRASSSGKTNVPSDPVNGGDGTIDGGDQWTWDDTNFFSVLPISGNSFYFDADDPNAYAPNLVGEMTNAFVPEKSTRPDWVFPELWEGTEYIRNPVETYRWDLPNPDNPDETIAYVMEEWILRMYVSVTAEWDEGGLWQPTGESEKWGYTRYKDTRIWIELDISPIWYFEGADQVYFGLNKVVTSDVAKGRLGKTDDDYTPTSDFSVTPASGTSYRYLYHSLYGTTQFSPTDPKTYQGRILNPEIFGDKMYFHVDLNNFGTEAWGLITFDYKGDAVTWGFDVHVFVVGEWKVKDIEEIPDVYGREPQTEYGMGWFLARLLTDPRTQFWLIVGAIALIVLVLAIFAPSFLLVIFSLIPIGTSRSKKKKG